MKFIIPDKPDISEHVSFKEATKSFSGHPNNPGILEVKSMKFLSSQIYEPLVSSYDPDIRILSFFRCKQVNMAERQRPNSLHTLGVEMDISVGPASTHTNKELFEYIIKNMKFHELVWSCACEDIPFSNTDAPYLHISLYQIGSRNSNKAYREYQQNGKILRNRVIRNFFEGSGLTEESKQMIMNCGYDKFGNRLTPIELHQPESK